jgi:hypothetical protein
MGTDALDQSDREMVVQSGKRLMRSTGLSRKLGIVQLGASLVKQAGAMVLPPSVETYRLSNSTLKYTLLGLAGSIATSCAGQGKADPGPPPAPQLLSSPS